MRLLLLAILFVSFNLAKSQGLNQFLRLGVEEFDNNNFALAAEYFRIADSIWVSGSDDEITHPYEVINSKLNVFENEKNVNRGRNGILFKMGVSYENSHQYDKAHDTYKLLIEREPKHKEAKWRLVRMLMRKESYMEAQLYIEANKDDFNEQDLLKSSLAFAIEQKEKGVTSSFKIELDNDLSGNQSNYDVRMLDSEDMVTVGYTDTLYNGLAQFYFDGKDSSGVISLFSAEENMNVSNYCWVKKHNVLYFSAWKDGEPAQIYMANYLDGKFLMPKRLESEINVEGFSSKQPFYNEAKDVLYFASNKPGGEGGFDIWKASMDKYGNAKEVVNMGSKLNSDFDDESPYIANKTFFFSSKGYPGMGGLDIYKVSVEEGEYKIENIGYPLNSGKDDAYYVETKKGTGYLTSNRNQCEECIGRCYDIYTWENIQLFVEGYVRNKFTNEVIPYAEVLLTMKGANPEMIFSDGNGYYKFELTKDNDYALSGEKKDFIDGKDSVSTIGVYETTTFQRDLLLTQQSPLEITLDGIEYDLDKWDLKESSYESLDIVVKYLKENDDIIIELASHTDARGSDRYNYALSEKRSKSCVDYIISQGIDPSRIKSTWYGERKLLIEDAKTEEQHAKNRRTTFTIIPIVKEG